jgi:hypothetical protein
LDKIENSKMADRRLFEHENDAHLYLLWILLKFGMQVNIGYGMLENENRVHKINFFTCFRTSRTEQKN